MISAMLTIKVLVNSEELAKIERYKAMLIEERPGLCWEPVVEKEGAEDGSC